MSRPRYLMGIDGGGSAVRVVIVTPDLAIHGQSEGPTANPSVVGREAAAQTIQIAMRQALGAAGLSPDQIAAAGIGVAGAAEAHSAAWLRGVVGAVLPGARVAPSADYETALVGAFGERRGVLVLAGTGSLAYGVNDAGQSALVGGWGYLIGDEGSGYWIGREGLRAVVRAGDGRGPATALTRPLLDALQLATPRDLIPWLYGSVPVPTRDVANLAPLVLAGAAAGDAVAGEIVSRAAEELAQAAWAVARRLGIDRPWLAFAGGLLTSPNPLSQALCDRLGLSALPLPRHPPVIGAAILARPLLDEEPDPVEG